MEKFSAASVLAGIPLIAAAAMPVGGMYLAASILTLLSFGTFAIAKGSIHEVASAVLLVGAVLCIGFANLARVPTDVQTAAGHFSRKFAQPEPRSRKPEPAHRLQADVPTGAVAGYERDLGV
ncbi:hypothetical protein [Microvirga makkahensis]|uniref:Uncharacterized protein n=1 Tax=Microvirga makkahensis TaxID=1128670 RepID=A0A7X3MUD4_9HYPH|nr:hypothetical protein [Microvirga makkahensis]MXQ13228.1 hypothetical protein [Microvirga makkahensis]